MKILLKFTAVISLCAISLQGAAQLADTSKSEVTPERGTIEYQQKLDREMEAYKREQERLEHERHGERRHEVGDEHLQRHEIDDENLQRREVDDEDYLRPHVLGRATDSRSDGN